MASDSAGIVKFLKSLGPSKVVWFLMVFVLVYSTLNLKLWKNAEKEGKVIAWDVTSYYGYLPAAFIHHDLKMDFIDGKEDFYAWNMMFWPKRTADGKKVFKMTMGLSILYSPFFALAHIYAGMTDYPQNGFSVPYEAALVWSSVFYLIIGLFFLRKVLLNYFNEEVSSIVLVIILGATNLYYYGTTEPCMSHAYNFTLISILLYLSMSWHQRHKLSQAIGIGLVCGLLTLIRPTNIIYFTIPIMYGFSGFPALWKMLYSYRYQLIGVGVAAFLMVLPQLVYWKYATGDWFYYSYGDENMFLTHPHILESLFAYRNGWIVYTPIMIFGLIGLFWVPRYAKEWTWIIAPLMVLNIYILSSWWCWWYGGAFGGRAYIDSYPLMALALGAIITAFLSIKKKTLARLTIGVIVLAAVTVNAIQTYQSRMNIIHWAAMTKEAYWHHFLKLEHQPGYEEMLKDADVEKAMKGEKEYDFDPF